MPELRKDPIIGRWVIIATERNKRPTDYPHKREPVRVNQALCPFCSGNEDKTPPELLSYRPDASGPDSPGWTVRVVPNKFPALHTKGEPERKAIGLYNRIEGTGAHEVIIETPHHQQTLSIGPLQQVEQILLSYQDRILALKKDSRFKFILIFKNHGKEAGATIDHPHSQLIALPIIPRNVNAELTGSADYHHDKGRCIFCDMILQESAEKVRIITENEFYLSFAPYASRFPFESCILPKTHRACFETVPHNEITALAHILRDTLRRQDKVLDCPAYNFIIHSSPFGTDFSNDDFYHWHLEIMPRLTNIAGFERGTGFYINPTPPEESAKLLREINSYQ